MYKTYYARSSAVAKTKLILKKTRIAGYFSEPVALILSPRFRARSPDAGFRIFAGAENQSANLFSVVI